MKAKKIELEVDFIDLLQSVAGIASIPGLGFVAQGLDEELAYLCEEERIDQLEKLGIKLANICPGGKGVGPPPPSPRAAGGGHGAAPPQPRPGPRVSLPLPQQRGAGG